MNRSITAYSHVKFKIFSHNSLKKDVFLGETAFDIYDILKKNNGIINNLSFPLSLKIPRNTSTKSLLSDRGPNYIFISIDGVSIDMNNFPQINNHSTNEQTGTSTNGRANDDSEPCTSSTVDEITFSLPKWSLNDPYSNSTNSTSNTNHNNQVNSDKNKLSSPSRKQTNNYLDQPSTSTSNGITRNTSNAQQIEEPLPTGWEIRFDPYGR